MTEKLTILCTRELQRSIKDSVHRLLVSQIELCGIQDDFEWDKTHLRSASGSEFLFYGLRHNAEDIQSTEGIDICWVEEARKSSRETLDEILFPTIRKPGSEIWLTWNPKEEGDAVNEIFVKEGRSGAIVRRVNWWNNPHFPDVMMDQMLDMRAANPKLARRVWDGEIVTIGSGDYFPRDKATIIDQAPEYLTSVRGWDLAATEPSEDNPSPDFTAGVRIGIDPDGKVIVMDVKMGQMNADAVRRLVLRTADEDQCPVRLAQDPGQAGKEQAASYKRLLHEHKVGTPPVSGDKEVRSEMLSAEWQRGNVYIVRGDWNDQYLDMMDAFPRKEVHDDVVDASNDAFGELINPTIESGYNLDGFG